MNRLQKQLFVVIRALMESPNFAESVNQSAIRYGLLNYVAKYSLANDFYLATPRAMEHLTEKGFLRPGTLRRGRKSKSNGFTYEHPVPSNTIADEILRHLSDRSHTQRVLEWTDLVTVLTSEEDAMLNRHLRHSMPDQWRFFDGDPFARYAEAGLEVKRLEKLPVVGAITR